MCKNGLWGLLLVVLCGVMSPVSAAPAVMLANVYHAGIRLADYRVSEKYDGLRAYWDGRALWTRGGQAIAAPDWFTAGWPAQALDGELWVGRGRFQQATAIALHSPPDAPDWHALKFMLFDLPAHPGDFDARDAALGEVVKEIARPWVVHVEQRTVFDEASLMRRLDEVVQGGGEGLMLHRGGALYRAERNDDLLKLKPYQDADARVTAHLPGKGKYAGQLGALEVETPDGLRFRLGSGLSDAERRDPPPLGSWISYRYSGIHAGSGLPRFARFLRRRDDLP